MNFLWLPDNYVWYTTSGLQPSRRPSNATLAVDLTFAQKKHTLVVEERSTSELRNSTESLVLCYLLHVLISLQCLGTTQIISMDYSS